MEDKELFDRQQYRQIIAKYQHGLEGLGEWQLYYLCRSYYKEKEYQYTIKVYEYYKTKGYNKERLSTFYLWSIYHICFNQGEIAKERMLQGAEIILASCSQKENALLYNKTVFKVVEFYEKEKVNTDYASIYSWLLHLNPRFLENTERKIRINEDEERRTAGDREKWYAKIAKAAHSTKQYEETIRICKEALTCLLQFHNNSDIWFRYRIAVSNSRLGNLSEAIKQLEELKFHHEHFCIYAELGEAYLQQGDRKKAKRYYYEALASRVGTLANKVSIIERLGNILLEDEELEEAKRNYLLVEKVRKDNKWNIPESLTDRLRSVAEVQISCEDSSIEQICKKEWKNKAIESLEQGRGTIVRILPNKRAGFIQTEAGDIYFKANELRGNIDNYLNQEVSFYKKTSYDMKRKRKSLEAVRVRVV